MNCKYKFHNKEKFNGKPFCTCFCEPCENLPICEDNCQIFEDLKELEKYKLAFEKVNKILLQEIRRSMLPPYIPDKNSKKILTFNLKKEWFEKIKSGEKTHEYREYKPYWITRISNHFNTTFNELDLVLQIPRELIKYIGFRCGYKGETIIAVTKSIRIADGLFTDLKINKPVFDIEFELIKEKDHEEN